MKTAFASTQLYHFELGIPAYAQTRVGKLRLKYSGHALRAAKSDRYGDISLPLFLDTDTAQVIEVEMEGRRTIKVVYRIKYNDLSDLILVVHPQDGFTRTVWINLNSDLHKTLDASKYISLKK